MFVASVISDIDLLILGLEHRGPSHSGVIVSLLFLPIFLVYGKDATPYFIAMVQHSIIGDYLTSEGVQLLWPVTSDWYGGGIKMTSLTNVLFEWVLFVASLTIMLKAKEARTLFQHHPTNLLLSIPALAILLELFVYPLSFLVKLIIPHVTYLTIFAFSVLTALKSNLRMARKNPFKKSLKRIVSP